MQLLLYKQNLQRIFLLFFALIILPFLTLKLRNGIVLIIIEGLLVVYFSRLNDEHSLEFFLICTVLQNFILILCASELTKTETQLLIILKESLIYINAGIYLVRNKLLKIYFTDVFFYLFLLICFIHLFINSRMPMASAVSLRQFLIPFFCYYYGKGLRIHGDVEKKITNIFISISIVVCLTGIIFYLFDPEKLWMFLGYQKYWENKTDNLSAFSMVNFYTYDLGIRLKRFTSIFADPLAFAHFIIVGYLLTCYIYPKKLYFIKLLFLISCILCLSKFHVVLLVVCIFLKVYWGSKKRENKQICLMTAAAFTTVIFIFLIGYLYSSTTHTATGNHLTSLLEGIRSITLFGMGLGKTGWNALLYSSSNNGKYFGESFFATISSQLGCVGIIPFYFFIISLIQNSVKKHKESRYAYISLVLLISVCIESFVSASSISMLGSGIYFILAGITNCKT